MKSREEKLQYNKDYNKRIRKERKTKGLCGNCGKRPIAKCSKVMCFTCVKHFRSYNNKNKERYRLQRRAWQEAFRDRLRIDAFNAYGGPFCRCCKEDTLEFLEIDHINNDGAEHRRKMRKQLAWNWIYSWLKKHNYPKGFQVLCSNCNKALWRYGQCPHEVDQLC